MKFVHSILIILVLLNFTKAHSKLDNEGPCENFYKYACSNYSENNPNTNYSEITQKLDYEMNVKLLKSLNYLATRKQSNSKKQTIYDKMVIYWEACQQSSQERDLRKYFTKIKPSETINWPLLEPKQQWLRGNKQFDFWSLLAKIQAYGVNNVIIKTDIARNKDNTLNIWLAPASKDNGDLLPGYSVLKVLLHLLGRKNDSDLIITQLKSTENKWHKDIEKYGSSHITKQVAYKDLAFYYPNLNLQMYLKHLLGKHELENISLITLEDPKYFEFLNDKNFTKTELQQNSNYLMLKFLYYLAQDSSNAFTPFACIKDLRQKFDLSVNYLYYNDYFYFDPKQFRLYFDDILYKIKLTMAKYFEQNFLNLNRQQIEYLKFKLNAIKVNLGNLPENFTEQDLEQFYRDVIHLDRNNYYQNHLILLKHRFRKSLLLSQNQTFFIARTQQDGSLSSPFYVDQQNMIVIPFASFQMPFFQYLRTPLEQLAVFGFVYAHELTHAFDTSGLLYDHMGFPLDYLSDILLNNNFTKSLNCMQQQEFTEKIDERIADLFAVRVVYRTYKDYYAKKGDRNWPTKFFMNLAQFFCGKENLKFIDHDTDSVRLEQIVKNFQPFSAAFRCSEGNRLYTRKRCRLY